MLQIEHLTKCYTPGVKAVDDLSLHVGPGDLCGFIGHNGAGKTTTLKAVAGILRYDEGTIRVDGHDMQTDALAGKKALAYIPDNPDLYHYLTGIKYLNFVADVFEVDQSTRTERIGRYAEALEMTPKLGELIGACSHGMKQKIALIGALLHAPKLLLLDEPFVGLDPKAAHTVKQIMRELCAEGGAIFFSTHVLEVAEKLCNKVAIIKNGRLVTVGDMDKVKGDSSLEELFLELTDHA